eukprot:tig00020902_g14992.t1
MADGDPNIITRGSGDIFFKDGTYYARGRCTHLTTFTIGEIELNTFKSSVPLYGGVAPPDHETSKSNAGQLPFILPIAFGIGGVALLLAGFAVAKAKGALPSWGPKSSSPYTPYSGPAPGAGAGAGGNPFNPARNVGAFASPDQPGGTTITWSEPETASSNPPSQKLGAVPADRLSYTLPAALAGVPVIVRAFGPGGRFADAPPVSPDPAGGAGRPPAGPFDPRNVRSMPASEPAPGEPAPGPVLTWNPPEAASSGAEPVVQYQLWAADPAGRPSTLLGFVPGETLSYVLPTTAGAVGGAFVVRALGKSGSSGESGPIPGHPAALDAAAAPARDAPANLQLTSVTSGLLGGTSGRLSWGRPAAGNPAQYLVLQDGKPVEGMPGDRTSAPVSDLPRDRPAVFQVVPLDERGAAGTPSYPLTVGLASDPSSGINLTAAPANRDASSALLAWTAPTSAAAAGLAAYSVLADGREIARVPAAGAGITSYVARGLRRGYETRFSVVPLSSLGGPAGPASDVVPLSLALGRPASTAPTDLQLTNVSTGMLGSISGTLSWAPPQSGPVQSFVVLHDGRVAGQMPARETSVTLTNLNDRDTTVFSVVPIYANCVAGTASAPLYAGIPQNPGAGITLTASPDPVSGSSARLSWNRPRGGSGGAYGPISQYGVLRNGQQIATVPALDVDMNTFMASGLQPNSTSVYSVVPLSPSGSPSGPGSADVPVQAPLSSYGLNGSGAPFTAAGRGSAALSAPSNLQLTGISAGLMGGASGTLSWSRPASGAPESYQVLMNSAPAGSVSGGKTSVTVSDLLVGGITTLRVVPVGPGGVRGAESAPLVAGIPSDAGSGIVLTTAAAGASSARLAWTRPRGGAYGPISQYAVLSNGQQIATVPSSSSALATFTANNVQPGAVFSVVPLTAAGEASGPGSLDVPLSGSGGAGFGAPSAPSNLQLTGVDSGLMGGTSGTLSWSHPASGAPESYQVLMNGASVGTVSGGKTSMSVSDLPRGGVANLSVVPIGAGGVRGAASAPLYAGIPSDPGSGIVLTSAAAGASSARLAWTRPRGAASGSVFQYRVLRNGQQIATVPASGAETTVFTANGVQPGSAFSIVPLSATGNPSGPGSVAVPVHVAMVAAGAAAGAAAGYGAGNGTRSIAAPGAPSNLQLTGISAGLMGGASGTLSWSRPASGAPESYQVLMNGAPAGSVSGGKTSVTVSDLLVGGITTLSVVPVGPGGVRGAESAPLVAGIPSDAGSGIVLTTAVAGASSARLAWTRPRGGAYGPISQYAVLSNGQQIATVPSSSSALATFTANNVQPGAVFSVVPLSATGNPSGPGSLDVPLSGSGGAGFGAPSAPSNLQLTGVDSGLMGGTSGTLSWSHPASGAPESYQVLMNGAPAGSVSGGKTSMSVSDLPRDGVANLSVVPIGAGGVRGTASAPLYAGIPSDPGSGIVLTTAAAGASSARLAWTRPRGAASGSVFQYGVLRNGQQIATVPVPASGAETTVFTANCVQPGSAFSIAPLSATGNPSGPSSVAVPVAMVAAGAAAGAAAGYGAGNGTRSFAAPGAPSNLQLTGISAGLMGGASGTLSWSRPASGAPRATSVVPVGPGGVRGAESAPLVAGIPSDAGSSSGIALTAAVAGASSARLAWTRPRGGAYGPISQYAVLSNGQQIATVPYASSSSALATFTANNVQPGAVFSVVPLSAAGEASGPGSLDVPLSGSGGAGFGAPSAPSNLQLTGVDSGLMGGTSGTLSWSHPASGAPESYQVLMNGAPAGSVSGGKTSMSVSDLPRDGVANLSVVPIGAGGVRGTASAPLYAGIPSDPGSGIVLTTAAAGASSARLAWTRPRGAASGSVFQYGVLRNGQQIATVPVPASGAETTVFTANCVQPGSAFSIVPLSATGNPSGPSSVAVPVAMVAAGAAAGAAAGYGAGNGTRSFAAPGAPSNLQLTGISAGLMGGASGTLSWSRPASGAPESYQVLMNGAPAGSVSGGKTSVTVSDLLVGGITTLSVVPVGPGGVRGAESAPLVAGIPSDAGSSSGIALTAAVAGASSARLAWTRPRGGAYGPISQYAVLSNGQQIATVPYASSSSALATFTANNVQPGAVFSVVPLSAAGNPSGPGSLDVPLSGSGGAGFGAPSAPSNLQLTGVDSGLMGGTSGTLSWSHPALGAPESYQVLMNGAPAGSVSGGKTSMSVSDLPRGGVANLSVVPIGAGGVRGAASAPLYAGIPSDPGSGIVLTTAAAGASSARLAWTHPRGAASGSVFQYRVLRNGQQIATVPASGAETTVFTANGVQPGSAFSIVPLSATGNPSGPGSVAVPVAMVAAGAAAGAAAGYGAGNGTRSFAAPGAPSNLQLTGISAGLMGGASGTLSWSRPASGAPESYQVLMNGAPAGSVSGGKTSVAVSDLLVGGITTLSVVPVGPGGVRGAESAPLVAGIPSDAGSGIALTAAVAGASSARLAWTRPRGGAYGPISQYAVLSNGQQIATVPSSSSALATFTANNVQPGAVFSVVPLSAAGEASGPGSLDVPLSGSGGAGFGAPSAPSNLQLTGVDSGLMGGTSGTLSWSHPASGAPESYQVLMNGAPAGTVSGGKTSMSVSDLPRGGVANLSVVPIGAGGVRGTASAPLYAGIPSDPGSGIVLTTAAAGASSARLAWTRPRGAASGSVFQYGVLRNGQQIATVPASGAETNLYTANGVQPGSAFAIVPVSATGNPSGPGSVEVPLSTTGDGRHTQTYTSGSFY